MKEILAMIDKRPKQLIENINARMESNDTELSDALDALQSEVLAGKAKPTIAELRKHCGLSEGAIRSRTWAILRLKAIKQAIKDHKKNEKTQPKEKSEPQLLKERIRGLLAENAILFDEIIGLQELISRRDKENQVLLNRLKIKINNK